LGAGLAEHVHPRERALEARGGAGVGGDEQLGERARGQDLRRDQAEAPLGALPKEQVEQHATRAGAGEDATDRPQVAAATFGVALDEPGGGRREQRASPVQPLTLHGPRAGLATYETRGGGAR